MLQLLFVLTAFSIVPHDDVIEDHVDIVEINHFYDEHGRLTFDQVLYYKWIEPTNVGKTYESRGGLTKTISDAPGFHIIAWRLVKDGRSKCPKEFEAWRETQEKLPPEKRSQYQPRWIGSKMVPRYDEHRKCLVSEFRDGDVMRRIIAKSYRETHTQYDPEQYDRKFLTDTRRPELTKPFEPKKVPQQPVVEQPPLQPAEQAELQQIPQIMLQIP